MISKFWNQEKCFQTLIAPFIQVPDVEACGLTSMWVIGYQLTYNYDDELSLF